MTGVAIEDLSLNGLLQPTVLADPYPLYQRLRTEDPVHWDPYLHAFVVTRYADVTTVLHRYSAVRTPAPDKLNELGLTQLVPIAEVMVRQMIFADPPEHTRLRAVFAAAFTPRRMERLADHIAEIADRLLAAAAGRTEVDVMTEFAEQLPAIVTAELLGLPTEDHLQLKEWSAVFAEMLGNFQHNPERAHLLLANLSEMLAYFRDAIGRRAAAPPTDEVVSALVHTPGGHRLTADEAVANLILTMVGGQETTTNLIGNGLMTLLRHPDQLALLRQNPELLPSAVEELLRFESPSQHTARIAPEDTELGGVRIRRGQAVIAVMGSANRDRAQFTDPDRLDVARPDNHHLAFGWSAHFCFGAGLARLEGRLALEALLRRFPDPQLVPDGQTWRPNLGLRGMSTLMVAPGW